MSGNKLLILEDKVDQVPSDFDHVFSYRLNRADSFPEDYITQAEVNSIYDEIYQKICDLFSSEQFTKKFSYRGVNLLWCFKKELFHCAYSLTLRYETFKRVLNRYPAAHIYLTKKSGDLANAGLVDLIEWSRLKQSLNAQIHLLEVAPVSVEKKVKRKKWRISLWPKVIKIGATERCQTAVFSDFERSKSVLSKLGHSGCILFSNSASPRTILRALFNRVGLYQVACVPGHVKPSLAQTKSFLKLLRDKAVFKHFNFEELNEAPFLQRKMEKLFESYLSRLLFEIDQMHDFFSQAPSLKSVLLDEDIDASKNAFCQVARQFSVTSFVELHGGLGGKHGVLPLTADKIFVWGNPQKNKLIRWGCLKEKIVVSGCSRYGRYQRMDSQMLKKKIVRQFKLDYSRKIGLLVLAPFSRWYVLDEHKMSKVISEVLEVAADSARKLAVQFIIKVHPYDENRGFYEKWVKQNQLQNQIIVITKKYDPLILAKAVDFLIVYGSTYAMDGFALDKPVVSLYDESYQLLEEFRDYSIFLYANSKHDLEKSILHLIQNPDLKPERWKEAKMECLNENVIQPENFIASSLINV